jgi:hypothetical protein
MIGSIVNVSGYAAFDGAGLAGLTRNFSAPASDSSRLIGNTGATLQALNDSRSAVDQIKSALTQLRDTLQAARDQANAVPGRTELQPVVADVAQTVDQPNYVTVDGVQVQDGTIAVAVGTRSLVVGYETANRAPLDVAGAVKSLASTVATLVASVGANDASGFAASVSALLQNSDFTTAVNTPDAASIDAAITQINDTLAKATGLGSSLGARAAAAAQVDLGGLLLGATPVASTSATTNYSVAYQSNPSSSTGTQVSSWA